MKNENKEKPQYYGIREIARRAKVSIGTVDRVIHNRKGVSEKTRLNIEKIIKDLDYQPNVLASRLASRKIYRIAVLVPSISKETNFWNAPIQGIKRAAQEIKQYGVLIDYYFFQLGSRDSFLLQTEILLKKDVDGVLLAPLFKEDAGNFAAICLKRKLPLVYIDDSLQDHTALSYIGPNLADSGKQAAQLFDFCSKENDKILIANISWEIDDYHIEQGFRTYFLEKGNTRQVVKANIRQTDFPFIESSFDKIFDEHPDIKGIFVTNSRVGMVANFISNRKKPDVFIIGYDLTSDNIKFLKNGIINFLICHKPEEQGYLGIMAFYQHIVMGAAIKEVQYMPIDILTKYNYQFY